MSAKGTKERVTQHTQYMRVPSESKFVGFHIGKANAYYDIR